MERIVVGVDGSDGAQRALQWAIAEARLRGATVEVVHAWRFPFADTPYPFAASEEFGFEEDARAMLDGAVDTEDTDGVDVQRVLVCQPTASSLLDAAKDADLLVVGSRGHGGFTGLLLGSVSQQVVRHARCPVVVIPVPHPQLSATA